MITRDQAMNNHDFHAEGGCILTYGERGSQKVKVERWRKNGKTRTKLRAPEFYEVPIKHGMYNYSVIRDGDEGDWHVPEDCAVLKEYHNSSSADQAHRITVRN